MTEERRFSEDEVREIFGLAADDRAGLPAGADTGPTDGLTLPELREIGRQVGLAPERIDAAASLVAHRSGALKERTYLGLPISVGRSVPLDRPLTDTEWEILVGELRETFGARGRVRSEGALREWVNGNLHVFQETTEHGHRLRLQTTKGTAVTATRIGVGLLTLAAVLMVVMVVAGVDGDLFAPLLLGGLGLAALGSNAVVLPAWASRREEQMDYIAARARALTAPDRED